MRKIPGIKSLKKKNKSLSKDKRKIKKKKLMVAKAKEVRKKDKMMVGPKISSVQIKIKRKMPRSTLKIKMLIKMEKIKGGVKKISEV